MRTFLSSSLFAAVLLTCAAVPQQAAAQGAADVEIGAEQAPERLDYRQAYARSTGKFLYVWAYPMVKMHNLREAMVHVEQPGLLDGAIPAAPLNRLAMRTDFMDSANRLIASPNQDLIVGQAWLDLTGDNAVIVQVPEIEDRYYAFEMLDQRSEAFASVGSLARSGPGFYLVVGPDYAGQIPKGITQVLYSPTNTALVLPQVFMKDTRSDRRIVESILREIDVYPVAEYNGEMKETDWGALPIYTASSTLKAGMSWVRPDVFWDQLPTVLARVAPMEGEQVLYDVARQLIAWAEKYPEYKAALRASAEEAEAEMVAGMYSYGNIGMNYGSGWHGLPNAADWDTDFVARTSAARAYVFVPKAEDVLHLGTDTDAAGILLDGSRKYTITFAAGELPPLEPGGFWSVSAYDALHGVQQNEQGRYSVGTNQPNLKFQKDGSVTLYLQSERPRSRSEQANWLPIPLGKFSLLMRSYMPHEVLLSQEWDPPAVVRVQ